MSRRSMRYAWPPRALIYISIGVLSSLSGVSGQLNLKIVVDLQPKLPAGLVAAPWPIQVTLADGTPAEGASVSVWLPADGPSGTFLDGSRSQTFTTDDRGVALVEGLRANTELGRYREGVRIEVSYREFREMLTIIPENTAPGRLRISVKSGTGTANVKNRLEREAGAKLTVHVTDESNRAVWGAQVRFQISDPGYARFEHRQIEQTVETSREGLASARIAELADRAGHFEILVTAWVPGYEETTRAEASIARINFRPGGCGGGCKALLTLAVMAGGYGGACAAKKVPPCNRQAGPAGGPAEIGLIAGAPVFGPPK